MRLGKSRKFAAFWVLAMVSAILAGCGGSASRPTALPGATSTVTGDVATGRDLFQRHCVVCHKADASGGVAAGGATSADLRRRNLEPQYHNDTALLSRALLDGQDQDGAPLEAAMPRWRNTLSEKDAQALIAYLKTLP